MGEIKAKLLKFIFCIPWILRFLNINILTNPKHISFIKNKTGRV